jgi:hypothetical protein
MARAAALVSMLRRKLLFFFLFCYQHTRLSGVASFSATLDCFGFSFLSLGLLWSPHCLDIVCD